MWFEPTISVLEWAKRVHALDCAVTVISVPLFQFREFRCEDHALSNLVILSLFAITIANMAAMFSILNALSLFSCS
jgi:hypothetical protein